MEEVSAVRADRDRSSRTTQEGRHDIGRRRGAALRNRARAARSRRPKLNDEGPLERSRSDRARRSETSTREPPRGLLRPLRSGARSRLAACRRLPEPSIACPRHDSLVVSERLDPALDLVVGQCREPRQSLLALDLFDSPARDVGVTGDGEIGSPGREALGSARTSLRLPGSRGADRSGRPSSSRSAGRARP